MPESTPLTMAAAQRLAASLVTIGHPYAEAVINATARDLIKWCKDEEQAEALVEEARTTWEGWPERGGTKMLLHLYRSKFGKSAPVVPAPGLEFGEAVIRGLIAPPCPACENTGYVGDAPDVEYCTCVLGRHAQSWNGAHGLQRVNAKPMEIARTSTLAGGLQHFTPITPEQMAEAIHEEHRRREEQLAEVESQQDGRPRFEPDEEEDGSA